MSGGVTVLTRPTAETSVPRARPVSPYKGLAPFEDSELDALLFFGRERERKVIAANLVASRLTVLYGPSGVGKSSVLRAGVARDLRALPEHPGVVVFDTWADDPLRALDAAVAASASVEPTGSIVDTIALVAAMKGELYLVLDQWGVLLYHGGERGPGTLDETLPEIVNRPELAVHVLIGVREDALARLDSFKRRIPGLFANSLRLDRLDREAGRRAILGPVERFGEISFPRRKASRSRTDSSPPCSTAFARESSCRAFAVAARRSGSRRPGSRRRISSS